VFYELSDVDPEADLTYAIQGAVAAGALVISVSLQARRGRVPSEGSRVAVRQASVAAALTVLTEMGYEVVPMAKGSA